MRAGADRRLAFVVVFSITLCLAARVAAQGNPDPVFDAKGFQANRDYVSELPFEHVDTISGGLVLTFTDLMLPGNAGGGLRVQRTYNSKNGLWTFGLAGIVLRVVDNWPDNLMTDRGPTLYTSDGGERLAGSQLYDYPGDLVESRRIMMTDRFWKYYRSSRILWMPDGSVSQYDSQGRLVETTDSFGNQVRVAWETGQVRVTQDLGNGQSREVVLAVPSSYTLGRPGHTPTSMSFQGRQWIYNGGSVTPPVGPGWVIDGTGYVNNQRVLNVTTPHGGRIEYTLEARSLPTGDGTTIVSTEVTTQRRGIDRGGQVLETRTYAYDFQGSDVQSRRTIVTGVESGIVTTFYHGVNVVMASAGSCVNGSSLFPARFYLLGLRTVEQGGTELEREVREYACRP